ncbi:MAG: hypothetical protein CMH57_03635 [Myxococcales bacterium]|nr:hypothetical protein [Myxococcales bacterium]
MFRRPDGDPVAGSRLSPLRQIMPFIMPGRNEAAVYFEDVIDVTDTLAWLEEVNAGLAEARCNFFHVILTALVRTMAERPRLNRFIAGQRAHQHRDITLAFAVKKAFADNAPISTVKVTFQPDDTLDMVARRVVRAVHTSRTGAPSTSDREAALITRLPRFAIRALVRAQRALDELHLLPAALTRDDPLYASAMLANLGSIGLDAPFHHLFEYGTVPIFATIGRIKRVPMVMEGDAIVARDAVSLKFSVDERIADGYYLARSLERFREYVQHPERLQRSPEPDGEG